MRFKFAYSTSKLASFKSNDSIVAITPELVPLIISPTDRSYNPETFKEFSIFFVT